MNSDIPVKILFSSSNPAFVSRLRLEQELREIREGLRLSGQRDRFILESGESISQRDFSRAIFDVEPQILHLSGHGASTDGLYLENLEGKVQFIQPDALAALFKLVADKINCVILNACYSETQAKAIAKHIPFVIGINQAIGYNAAIAFSVGFYKALAANRSIEDAYQFGCVEIQLQGMPEYLTPVLYINSQTQNLNKEEHVKSLDINNFNISLSSVPNLSGSGGFIDFKESFPKSINSSFTNYEKLAQVIFQNIRASNPILVESLHFEKGTVWEVILPMIGLRLRTQKAIIFLREKHKDSSFHEYLSETTYEKNAAFLIVIDIEDLPYPPMHIGKPTIWFSRDSLTKITAIPENELLGWLGRFITTQIDISALPGLLPYQTTGAAQEELFFGRDYELTCLIGGNRRGGVIVGAHRSGKTSLLYQLRKRLKQQNRQVSDVLTIAGIDNFQSFFERTLEALDIDLPEEITPASWASALRTYTKNNQNPIFLLDEVDDLISLDTQSGFALGKQMRSLQSDGYCEFYLAGHAKLREAVEVEGGPFRNFALEITLKGLTEKASMRLIQQPMKLIGFQVTDEQACQIIKGTAGVAVLIQEFCVRLLREVHQINTPYIENDEIKKIEQSPEYLSVVFEHYKYAQAWDSMAVLLLTNILGEVKKRDIIKELDRCGAMLTGSRLEKVLEFLVRFGVLEEFQAGEYRVLPGYLLFAIQARDPQLLLESALEEGGVSKAEVKTEKAAPKKGMGWFVAKAKNFFTD